MAPSATETVTLPSRTVETSTVKLTSNTGPYKELAPIGYEKSAEEEGTGGFAAAKVCMDKLSRRRTPADKEQYQNYLPHWGNEKYPPLEPFEHRDHGLDADPSYPELLPEGVEVSDLTPTIGTEVKGVQLSKLSNAGKDQLARYVAQRKVVAFRDQDFADLPISEALDYGRYFGRLHIHPTSGAPEGYPEVHLVHRGAGDKTAEAFFQTRTSSVAWHSDVAYELQPPGTTFLYILDVPEAGGDTLFANQVEAYNRLSPAFQERLHGLRATHSGIEQVNASRFKGGAVRREPVISEHPVVRTHPVTGEKALYVNPQCNAPSSYRLLRRSTNPTSYQKYRRLQTGRE
jgi:sulfonate dioxygenase